MRKLKFVRIDYLTDMDRMLSRDMGVPVRVELHTTIDDASDYQYVVYADGHRMPHLEYVLMLYTIADDGNINQRMLADELSDLIDEICEAMRGRDHA